MKKVVLIFCFSLLSQFLFCQILWYSAQPEINDYKTYSRSSITINMCKKEVRLSFILFNKYFSTNARLSVVNGIYKFNIFHFQEIRLKKIDNYRLLVVDKSLFFKKNELLYCHSIDDCNYKRIEGSMFWKDGLRDGCWQRYIEKGVISIIYNKGKKVKVFFKTYEEIDRVSSKLPKL